MPLVRARSKIRTTSASEAATGLSMNTGFCAANTGWAWARCGRPSMLSNITASTFGSSSSTVVDDLDAHVAHGLRVLLDVVGAEGNVRAEGRDGGDHFHVVDRRR